ncbi:hypothetical protein H2200_005529 [Cladophialophora chaetospira]|uniref:AMP-dependent synthetase/ligase domain-containing protein n=1 Tax=Cladophialophora chaetospira TaxID=386627 RepID=A0AA38XCA3_9EURO|nr:hypothetical protein H2200_005529 [Cladophialophora chaetospira]
MENIIVAILAIIFGKGVVAAPAGSSLLNTIVNETASVATPTGPVVAESSLATRVLPISSIVTASLETLAPSMVVSANSTDSVAAASSRTNMDAASLISVALAGATSASTFSAPTASVGSASSPGFPLRGGATSADASRIVPGPATVTITKEVMPTEFPHPPWATHGARPSHVPAKPEDEHNNAQTQEVCRDMWILDNSKGWVSAFACPENPEPSWTAAPSATEGLVSIQTDLNVPMATEDVLSKNAQTEAAVSTGSASGYLSGGVQTAAAVPTASSTTLLVADVTVSMSGRPAAATSTMMVEAELASTTPIEVEEPVVTAATAAVALATATGLSAYLNAKYHIGKDLSHLYYQRHGARYQERVKAQNKINIWATFCENSHKFADKDCIWYSDPSTSPPTIVTYTWREAREYAYQYAEWFLQAGVQPGDCVGFYLQNSPDFVLGWLGLLAIRCYPAMINYNLVGGALVHCVKIAECKILLVDEDFSERVLGNEELQRLGISMHAVDREFRARISRMPVKVPSKEYTKDVNEKTRLALRYTRCVDGFIPSSIKNPADTSSGTTGYPKGVMATVGRYYMRLGSQFTQMGIHPLQADGSGDRWYICMPMCHTTAGSAVVVCMIMPTTMCIGSVTKLYSHVSTLIFDSKKFSASRFWDEVRTSRSTMATYVGEIARYLLASPPSPMDRQHSLRMVYGNGIRPDVWGRFQERFGIPKVCEFYGSTEGGLSHLTIQEGDFLRNAVGHDGLIRRWQLRNQLVTVLVDAETNAIVRDSGTGLAIRMAYEVGGELLFRLESEANFVGYWKNPEATEKKFARNVLRKGDLWYRSGDSLKRDKDGKWSFLDRLGDTFRWKGENVSTAEVSECLGRYPGVVDANVYGVQLPNHDGRAGCAALMVNSGVGQSFDLDGLLRHARRDLPGFAVPLFLRMVSSGALNAFELKQDKVQPRAEGVDPEKVRGDQLYVLRGDRYVLFTKADWEDLSMARARL